MKNEDLFHYLRNAENIGKRKYKLMGFKNPKRIDELVELDLYFTTMVFLNRQDIVTAAMQVSDELRLLVKNIKEAGKRSKIRRYIFLFWKTIFS